MQENTGHYSVMLNETIEQLNIKPDGIYVDCTLGGAGHSKAIVEKLTKGGKLYGFDRDEYAISKAKERLKGYEDRYTLIKSNFVDASDELSNIGVERIDGVVADLGVSSFQLDNADRGFSYMQTSRLDMRMSREDKLSAYEVVNTYEEKELSRVINLYGEERFAGAIAKRICKERENAPIETTTQLSEIIKSAIPTKNKKDGPHPAKRTFQAIRIEVNSELDVIDKMIQSLFEKLQSRGRMAIITFHSLEDRIVKQTFAEKTKGCECPPDFPVCVCGKKPTGIVVTRKPILPSEEELEENPRSRSAKLRVIEKI